MKTLGSILILIFMIIGIICTALLIIFKDNDNKKQRIFGFMSMVLIMLIFSTIVYIIN
jgi:predicted membrane channel-forming protein YqfA (hemolysin III family)